MATAVEQVKVILRKWDGTTETDICEGTSGTNTSGGGYAWLMHGVGMDIPQTHFKKGETLRMTVQVWYTNTAASGTIRCGHDPMSTEPATWTADIDSNLIFNCPVRVDL